MAKRRISPPAPPRRRTGTASTRISTPGRELVVMTTTAAGLRAAPGALSSTRGANVAPLSRVLQQHAATLLPLFGSEERVSRTMAAAPAAIRETADLTRFYRVEATEDRLEALCAALLQQNVVEAAFIKPPVSPPVVRQMAPPSPREAPPVTPNFIARQRYLEAAPGGIDARFAWTRPGGRGQNVRIVDIEGAWRFTHEDLLQNQGGVIGGTQNTDIRWRDHGTAVAGVIAGDENTIGVTGICPDANIRAISVFGTGQSSAKAITDAANALGAGDIILIELHRPGPRLGFAERDDQMGYIAVEFWPDDFAAIVFATSVRGVIVIEAAGNGSQNFDDPLYDTVPNGWPSTWRNPFNLANPQSGAIIVGAGAPPSGAHGADRSRLDFSNFGARVDVQGWGEEVTTCGYGDLQGGSNEDFWYTDSFSGTSSASPIVVGAVGCLQGGLLARGRTPLTPATARDLLRRTGSPQQDEPGRPASQRIGNRPDIFAAFHDLGLEIAQKEILKDSKDFNDTNKIKDSKEGKEKTETKELMKEVKDKEGKEKEKEVKDSIKDTKEHEELATIDPGRAFGFSDRLTRLEAAVASLAHFIQAGDRPDLRRSALGSETDLAVQLARQAGEAKAAKDAKDKDKDKEKDAEKGREY